MSFELRVKIGYIGRYFVKQKRVEGIFSFSAFGLDLF
jgi:hypothetical protein